jgi:hypothetical protein
MRTLILRESTGYALKVTTTGFSPLDATTYYMGMDFGHTTVQGRYRLVIPKSGVIKAISIMVYGGNGSSELVTVDLLVNGVGSVGSHTENWSNIASTLVTNIPGLGYPVLFGDYLELRMVCPTWVTNPTTMAIVATVYVE